MDATISVPVRDVEVALRRERDVGRAVEGRAVHGLAGAETPDLASVEGRLDHGVRLRVGEVEVLVAVRLELEVEFVRAGGECSPSSPHTLRRLPSGS